MELKNCIDCGKVFIHPSRDLCPSCYEVEEVDFKKVREYLWNKRSSSVEDVHEMTGVPVKRIVKFIRERRLTGMGVDLTMPCEGCGTPIFEGRFCADCRDRIMVNLTEGGKDNSLREEYVTPYPEKPKTSGKMYIAERRRRR